MWCIVNDCRMNNWMWLIHDQNVSTLMKEMRRGKSVLCEDSKRSLFPYSQQCLLYLNYIQGYAAVWNETWNSCFVRLVPSSFVRPQTVRAQWDNTCLSICLVIICFVLEPKFSTKIVFSSLWDLNDLQRRSYILDGLDSVEESVFDSNWGHRQWYELH